MVVQKKSTVFALMSALSFDSLLFVVDCNWYYVQRWFRSLSFSCYQSLFCFLITKIWVSFFGYPSILLSEQCIIWSKFDFMVCLWEKKRPHFKREERVFAIWIVVNNQWPDLSCWPDLRADLRAYLTWGNHWDLT